MPFRNEKRHGTAPARVDMKLKNDGISASAPDLKKSGSTPDLRSLNRSESTFSVPSFASSASFVRSVTSAFTSVTSASWKRAINKAKAVVKVESEMEDIANRKTLKHQQARRAEQISVLAKKNHLVHHMTGVLGDVDALKASAHDEFYTEEYDVTTLYHQEGIAQWIVRSVLFTQITLAAISLNAVWLGISADRVEAETLAQEETYVQVIEHSFTVFFLSEIIIRFCAFARKLDGLKDGWLRFDSFLVALMVLETWVLPAVSEGLRTTQFRLIVLVRIVRLIRLTRLMRLMRKFPELMTLLKAMGAGLRSASFTICLLLIFMYVFAIVFRQQAGENEALEAYFGTMGECFWTLFLHGTLLDDISGVLREINDHSPSSAVLMLMFILFGNFTVLNMLIGVLCEVVCAVGTYEKDKQLVDYTKKAFWGALVDCDVIHDGRLNRQEFEHFVEHPKVETALKELGVDQRALIRSAELIYSEDKRVDGLEGEITLPFGVILEHILTLRSSNAACLGDIMDLQHFMKKNHGKMKEYHAQSSKMLLHVLEKLEAMNGSSIALTAKSQRSLSKLHPDHAKSGPGIRDSGKANASKLLQKQEDTLSLSSLPPAIPLEDPHIQVPQHADKGFKMPVEPCFVQAATVAALDQKIEDIIQHMRIEVQELIRQVPARTAASDLLWNDTGQLAAQALMVPASLSSPGTPGTPHSSSCPAGSHRPNEQIHRSKDVIVEASPNTNSSRSWANQAEPCSPISPKSNQTDPGSPISPKSNQTDPGSPISPKSMPARYVDPSNSTLGDSLECRMLPIPSREQHPEWQEDLLQWS